MVAYTLHTLACSVVQVSGSFRSLASLNDGC